MKQTENYGLKLVELQDTLSPAPLNENAQMLDAVLHSLATAADGHLKIATGSYTGNGAMSVSIETPGLKPRAMLVRKRNTIGCTGHYTLPGWGITTHTDTLEMTGGWLLWLGWDIPVTFSYVTEYDDDGEATDGVNVNTAVRFTATLGGLQWSVTEDEASSMPALVNNANLRTYDWIVLGTAGE